MGSNKKDLEIIYNLQWKNGNGTGHNDKSNILGMYDIPATTMNWETFKSYLLKNSGAIVDNVKVSYVSNEREFPIDSQIDFQIALYSFRQRARNNDVITLKLERIDEKPLPKPIQHNYFEVLEEQCAATAPPTDGFPDWFKTYMTEYKKEIIEEVTASVVNALSSVKLQQGRKMKEPSTKRLRKSAESNDKEIRKTLKLERKIEELEEKANKIKEKKSALTRSAERANRPPGLPTSDSELVLMNAKSFATTEITIPQTSGGELYFQDWLVTNTGFLPWTSETELRYAWGSEALKPIQNPICCPLLKPGETGEVGVHLKVPSVPGEYECYWHFFHKGRRFGQWLGCQVTVGSSPIQLLSAQRFDPINESLTVEPPVAVRWTAQPVKSKTITSEPDTSVADVSAALDNLTVVCSDSDNQSVVSVADSNSSTHTTHSDEFVVVPIEAETEQEVKPMLKDGVVGYAYVTVEGKKQAVPKMFLRQDYLETAEEALPPSPSETDNKRLFVFPLNCPGFEVVYPPNPMSDSILAVASSNDMTSGSSVSEQVQTVLENSDVPIARCFPQVQPVVENSDVPLARCYPLVQTLNDNDINSSSTMTLLENPIFTTAPSIFSGGSMPIFPPLGLQSPPISIPVPPPRTIPIPPAPIFSYSAHNNHAYYSTLASLNATAPPPAPCSPLSSHTFVYPYMYSIPPPPLLTQPVPSFEGDEYPTSPCTTPAPQAFHAIPETLVSGAVNVASSAINTARSVLNMFTSTPLPAQQASTPPAQQASTPQPVQEGSLSNINPTREQTLDLLIEMGFWNRELNCTLYDRFHGDIDRIVAELLI